eukprot:CAMPEP_0172460450 /NCGR_PEP_ID=MMETSP1065-20121228/36927_1 /TAXON_ID=265537 /ORGANISM="Amphiprora paludosa, Strain CCMP125" /LENGTH=73 /DNA_ID=CAMNT_0013215473 /DNA_START=18 /DNA_END=235 /DNA_ORIENTATION=+
MSPISKPYYNRPAFHQTLSTPTTTLNYDLYKRKRASLSQIAVQFLMAGVFLTGTIFVVSIASPCMMDYIHGGT